MADKARKSSLIDGVTDVSADDVLPDENVTVGAELRTVREAKGLALDGVATDLRIREEYLDAIENSRFVELPGTAYALGFVRSYAEYLGLDVAALVARFKAEISDLEERSELVFPAPVGEGRLPGGAMFLVSLVAAAVLYGIWYYYSSVPSNDSTAVARTSKSVTTMLAKGDGSSKTGKVERPAVPGKAKSVRPDSGKPAKDAVPVIGTKPDPVVSAKPQRAARPAGDTGSAKKAPAKAAASRTAAPPTRKTSDVRPAPAGSPPATAAVPGKKPDPDVSRTATTGKPAPKVAALPADTRVVLTATADTWIQIRDKSRRIVVSEILKDGSSHEFTAKPGMILHVGNAGTVRISVNGGAPKALGRAGLPRRNVSLDPASLAKLP